MKQYMEKIDTGNWLKDWLFPRYKFKDLFVSERQKQLLKEHDRTHEEFTSGECAMSPSCEVCKHFERGYYDIPRVYNANGRYDPCFGYVTKPRCKLWKEM